jgi:hypothetical protein
MDSAIMNWIKLLSYQKTNYKRKSQPNISSISLDITVLEPLFFIGVDFTVLNLVADKGLHVLAVRNNSYRFVLLKVFKHDLLLALKVS